MKPIEWYAGRMNASEYLDIFPEGLLTFPARQDYYRYKVINEDGGTPLTNLTREEAEKYIGDDVKLPSRINPMVEAGGGKIIKFDENREQYSDAVYKYNNQQSKLNAAFREDLKKEYLPSSLYSINDLIYSAAYDKGHSAGYDEVACHYRSLSDFVGECMAKLKQNSELFNCMPDYREPDWSPYDALEIQPVRSFKVEGDDETQCEVCDPSEAEFWSVYAHLKSGGVECITDIEVSGNIPKVVRELKKRSKLEVAVDTTGLGFNL